MERSEAVSTHLTSFPSTVAVRLSLLRDLVAELAPDSVESMAYGMPAYKVGGKPLVYFNGFAKHIGLYALPSAHAQFAAALADYRQGKGSVQFPHAAPFPLDLIAALLQYRLQALHGKI